jgi:hypothetical protein
MQTAVGVHLFFFCCKGSSAFFLFCKKSFFALQSKRKLTFLRGILESKSAFFDTRPSNLWNFRDFRKGIKPFFEECIPSKDSACARKEGNRNKKREQFSYFFRKGIGFL